ncbi:M6 family metalloprotease domain-containing protein [Nocardioides stalactiti]|uniref:M6 family metalloprotease domain-containing protein n=1 Tax=Nocardioides stalactiti TaxID=2755356 RepID=UPI0015FEC3F3|nr:M6 family metalloprotease domain-containing protein [Nocardioides stalactiti]
MSSTAASTRRWTLAGLLVLAVAAVAAALLLSTPAQAVPARPGVTTLSQPDGQEFKARQFGDEWYNGYETRAGHTILKRRDGFWSYARRTRTGELRASALVVGEDRPTMRRHLRDRRLSARAERLRTNSHAPVRVAKNVGGPRRSVSLGTEKSLVILARFNDQASLGTTPAAWSQAYFGGTKSVAHYYSQASGGQFTLSPAAESHGTVNDGVVGWVNVGTNHPNGNTDVDNRMLTRNAILAANPYVNYAAYDTDGDGVVRNNELHITVIAAGQEGSCCKAFGKWVWGHQWVLQGGEIPTVDGKSVGGWGYTQFGEMHGDHMATMGIMVHEIGHDLDLPDLYDTKATPTHGGIGAWSVMDAGSWGDVPGVDQYDGETPTGLDAWSRSFKGWITPSAVTGTQTVSLNAGASGTNGAAFQLLQNPGGPQDWSWQGGGSGEYFLVENRQQTGYDASLPGAGIVVWHIDETRGSNQNGAAKLVDIEEANGQAIPLGSDGDPGNTFKSGGATTFNGSTTPNSNLNNGTPTGVSMSGVGASGPTMQATFSLAGGSTRPANDDFAGATTIGTRVFDSEVNNTAATAQTGEFSQGGCSIGRTVWYRYTPTRDVRVKADTSGSSFDTVLNVWQGTTLAGLTAHSCNDDAVTNTDTTSRVPELVAQAGQTYYFQVGGYYDSGANTTAVGTLRTHVRIRPVNDDFAGATTLTGATGSTTEHSVGATRETGEPTITDNGGGGSVWWRWTAPASGQVTFDTLGSGTDVDTLLGVYTGSAVNGLSLVAANDDITADTNRKSRVTFTATAGTTYRIAVDTYNGENPGDLKLSWSGSAAATPSLAIGDGAVAEGSSGTRATRFVVTLSAPSPNPVTVKYATEAISATAGTDYVTTTGTLTIPAGTTVGYVNVSVRGDTSDEADETYRVKLSLPTGATLKRATGNGRVIDDDPPLAGLRVAAGTASLLEGTGGTRNAVLTVTLSAPAPSQTTVAWATVAGTATATTDYTTRSGTLTFAAGATTAYVIVPVKTDSLAEGTETFNVKLSAPSAGLAIGRATGVVSLLNDD